MTLTLHETSASAHTEPEESVVNVIQHSLEAAGQLPDDEADRRFNALIACAERLELPQYAKAGMMDEYVDVIANSGDFIDMLHVTAEEVLAHGEFNADSSLMVNNLGIAADITGDREILERTIEAIDDTHDFGIDLLKRALKSALEQDTLFYDAYRQLKYGIKVIENVVDSSEYIPMSQRPDFVENDELAPWLSKRDVEMKRHYTFEQVDEYSRFKSENTN